MNDKLLVLHTNGVITAALIIPVIDSGVQMALVGIDPAKEEAYRMANAGKTVTRCAYEEAVGIFQQRLIIIDPYGNANQHPADTLLLALTKTLPLADILIHAVAGKYLVKNKKLERNPNWQEPTLTMTAPSEAHLMTARLIEETGSMNEQVRSKADAAPPSQG